MPPTKIKKLTPKQARFVQEYLLDLNATQAATRAGYSEKTAYSIGQRLLKHVEIQGAIASSMAKVAQRTEITQDMILQGLVEEASFHGLGASHGARVSAYSLLGKHIGMFTDKIEQTIHGDGLRHVIVCPPAKELGAETGLSTEREYQREEPGNGKAG